VARYNHGFGISFNDNDGGASWFSTREGLEEYRRYARTMGRWRARLFFARLAWRSIQLVEQFSDAKAEPRWRRLRGWKP
jgi:hypothetical protein